MKYINMIKFLNDNGILLQQAVIADTVDSFIPIGTNISNEQYEDICETIFQKYLEDINADIIDLVKKEIIKRNL